MRRHVHAFRNYIKHCHEDRTFRWALVVMGALLALAAVALRPAPRYFLDGVPCKRYSDFAVICPVSPSAPAQFPVENPRKNP